MSEQHDIASKPRVLLVWGYHRKGWIEPFEKLKEHIEFVYLFHLEKPANEVNLSDCKTYYWLDYKSPYQLLDAIRPQRVVFMGIDRVNSIALNMACKHRKIKSFQLQHGLMYSFQRYVEDNNRQIATFEKNGENGNDPLSKEQKWKLMFFLLRTVRWDFPAALPFFFKFLWNKRKYGPQFQRFVKSLNSRFLIPYKYLVFTRSNGELFVERNGAREDDFLEIGNPFLDDFFGKKIEKAGSYYLLIDEPIAYNKEHDFDRIFTRDQVINFQKKLNDFALKKGKKLIVKLHPYSFGNDFYFQHENIEYLEEANIPELINGAEGVFGTSSTLLIPAVFNNRCVQFKIWDLSDFEADCARWGLTQQVDFEHFSPEDICFEDIEKKEENLQKMIQKYMYRIDGKATERLKEALLNS
ncbi:MAG: hypothetical protein EP338_08650 [Bacteroidetes bacterium]|nr:MAG: hypothetical protein EP338_08650 [Bacteroidota bacterium]